MTYSAGVCRVRDVMILGENLPHVRPRAMFALSEIRGVAPVEGVEAPRFDPRLGFTTLAVLPRPEVILLEGGLKISVTADEAHHVRAEWSRWLRDAADEAP